MAMRAVRHRRTALGAMVLCGVLTLSGCQGDDGGDGAAPGTPSVAPAASSSTGAKPGATATAAQKPKSKPTPTAAAGGAATPTKKPESPAPAATCDHRMPISPDEIEVNRYTPEGGFHSLIVKHGNWGCAAPDTDGAPFETVGKETFLPIAADAEVTAVTPIVASTENQKITLRQLIDWLVAHPDQGLVFRYHMGADGGSGEGPAIDTLDQVFTP
ncbi:hypothetical protein NJL88_01160 [Streptomyces sp. DK15]|uniref:hypothetical protein n=1 Tax=Streptomyces sp. DK15 TaxID=2957499 RepID=UPI0029A8A377|nr:hypothetical protein [Streptomyces sp. DK15]MDX2388714.1 hypothetical protein [Streptomyces sp. DK15]